jgi:hypothetical protein
MKSIHVPEKYQRALKEGLQSYMERTGLKLSNTSRVRTGDKDLSDNTKDNYKKHYDGLFLFAAMIGAYDTCFVLSYNAPTQFCPSMDANTVALYIRYKTRPQGEQLCRAHESTTPVLDVLNEPILCTGEWKAPINITQFVAAITRIHSSIKQRGDYVECCHGCVTAYRRDGSSCRFHPNQFLIYNRGNPRTSETVVNAVHAAKKLCSNHKVKGAEHLLPKEVRRIRQLLLSTGSLDDLQLFAMMLVQIYLFLRSDELHKIEVQHIIPEYSAVEKHKIINLCFQVQGKSDVSTQNLILWAYDDCPDLCPVRHLMAYVHLCKIESGFLFPNLDNRSKPRTYDSVMHQLNTRFRHILSRTKITTHTFRKTAYLFAIWGEVTSRQREYQPDTKIPRWHQGMPSVLGLCFKQQSPSIQMPSMKLGDSRWQSTSTM